MHALGRTMIVQSLIRKPIEPARPPLSAAPAASVLLRPRGVFCLLFILLSATWNATSARAQDGTGATGEEPATGTNASARQPFFFWMDNSLTILPYGWGFEVDPEEQSTLTFEHAHESAIGDLFFFIDGTRFHDVPDELGDDAEWTWYGEISPRLSVGKILDQDLSFSFFGRSLFEFKDLLLAAQYERGEDPGVTEAALLGLGVDLDVREAGLLGRLGKFNYVQLNLYARAEMTDTQRDGFRDMQVTMVAAYPIEIGSTRLLIDGYFDWVVGIGSEQSSFHLNPQVKLDLGNYWGQPEKLYAGVELDFWWDKYQIEDSSSLDTNQQAVSLLLKYHF